MQDAGVGVWPGALGIVVCTGPMTPRFQRTSILDFTFAYPINHTHQNRKLSGFALVVLSCYHRCVLGCDLDCACAQIREVWDEYVLAERGVPDKITIYVWTAIYLVIMCRLSLVCQVCTYPSTKAMFPPSGLISWYNLAINSSLDMLIFSPVLVFRWTSNCLWQNGSSATSAVLAGSPIGCSSVSKFRKQEVARNSWTALFRVFPEFGEKAVAIWDGSCTRVLEKEWKLDEAWALCRVIWALPLLHIWMLQLATQIIAINVFRLMHEVILICTPGTKRSEIRAQILRKQSKVNMQKNISQ